MIMVASIASSGAVSMSQIRNMFKGSSGAISMSELRRGGTSQAYGSKFYHIVPVSPSSYGIPSSGQISVNHFRGKAKDYLLDDVSTNTTNYNLHDQLFAKFTTGATANRIKVLNAAAKFYLTINSGVTVSASSTSNDAFTVGSVNINNAEIHITNNGNISVSYTHLTLPTILLV